MKIKAGFTLIELLLVIGLMAILAGLAVPVGMNFYRSQSVEAARGQLIETLTKARHNAVLMKGDSRYGVNIEADPLVFTLYKGNSFLERGENSAYDEVYEQAPNLTVSTTSDINFSKLTGTATATGTITISHTQGSEARSIIIDEFGNAYKI